MNKKILVIFGCLMAIMIFSVQGYADEGGGYYKVSVTNITSGQTFTPVIVLNHKKGVRLFTPGSPASEALSKLAEAGMTDPLAMMMSNNPRVADIATSSGPLGPGETTSVMVERTGGFHYISLAAMMLPTNDGFIALNGAHVPRGHRSVMYMSPAYDAGSEDNDQSCDHIPGPFGCDGKGEGFNPADGEGYVHIHAGIHDYGDIAPDVYDWRNPVARVVIQRVNVDEDDD